LQVSEHTPNVLRYLFRYVCVSVGNVRNVPADDRMRKPSITIHTMCVCVCVCVCARARERVLREIRSVYCSEATHRPLSSDQIIRNRK